MAEEKFSEIGRIEAIERLFEGTGYHPWEESGFEAGKKGNLMRSSSRMLLEGIDFDLTYFPLKHLGYKSVMATVGELYAALASPKTLSVTLGISAKLDFKQIKELWEGICTAAKEHGIQKLALDLIPSQNGLCISVSAAGETDSLTAKRRMPAKSMDLICISDNLGAAFMGLQILEKEKRRFDATKDDSMQPDLKDFLQRLKSLSYRVKLDTNGTRPDLLEELIVRGLIDAVAMDVKHLPSLKYYARITPNITPEGIHRIRRSISLLRSSGIEYQFRTTILPDIHTPEEQRRLAHLFAHDPYEVHPFRHPGEEGILSDYYPVRQA